MLLVLLISFFCLASLRFPVALALGITAAIVILLGGDIPLQAIPHKMVNGIDSYVFIAIPLFLLAGRLMNEGGITERIFTFAKKLVGHVSGGLAHANVIAGVIFSWMSGSAVAAVGGLGEIELKAMKENGYDAPFAASVTTASSVLGPIIPPSIPFIIYAAMTENSVGKLFLGGIMPGIILALATMLLIYFYSKRRGYPKEKRASLKELLQFSKDALLPLMMPVIMLGGIAVGLFTPTEAAAVAVAYAFVVSKFVYRTLKMKDLPGILVETMITTSVVTFVISFTAPFSYLLIVHEAGDTITGLINELTSNKYIVLFIINIILLVFGALMEAGVVLIIFIPILYPLAMDLGIDPIHFGVVMVVNLMIGVATPPMGVCLFVMSHISGIKLEVLMKAILPFLVPMLIVLLLITYFPELVVYLPNHLMK